MRVGFDPRCHGCPEQWKDITTLSWGRAVIRKILPRVPEVSASDFKIRLEKRNLLGAAFDDEHEVVGPGTYRFRTRGIAQSELPQEPVGKRARERVGQADWQRACHGPRVDTLFSIELRGALFASWEVEKGRTFDGVPGVCVHGDAMRHKTLGHVRFVP